MSTQQEQRRLNAAQVTPTRVKPVSGGTAAADPTTLAGYGQEALEDVRKVRTRRFSWKDLRGQLSKRPIHAFCAVLLLVFVSVAILGPALPLPDGQKQELAMRLQPPMSRSADGTLHLAGTDQLGRDVLARLIMGARVTLGIALVTVAIAGAFGTVMGLVAGYRGGIIDQIIMRVVDMQMAFPSLLFAMFLLFLMGATIVNLILLLAILGWTSIARIARAQTLSLRNMVYVEAAQSIGASNIRILARHIFPHLIPVLTVMFVFDFSGVMLAEAGLSYLGLGVQPPDTSWGRMISEGQQYVYTGGWWLFLFPGGAIFIVVLATRLTSAWIQEFLGRTQG